MDAGKNKGGLLLRPATKPHEGRRHRASSGSQRFRRRTLCLSQPCLTKDRDLQMPPKGEKLSDQEIADLKSWVKMGAPDTRRPAAKAQS